MEVSTDFYVVARMRMDSREGPPFFQSLRPAPGEAIESSVTWSLDSMSDITAEDWRVAGVENALAFAEKVMNEKSDEWVFVFRVNPGSESFSRVYTAERLDRGGVPHPATEYFLGRVGMSEFGNAEMLLYSKNYAGEDDLKWRQNESHARTFRSTTELARVIDEEGRFPGALFVIEKSPPMPEIFEVDSVWHRGHGISMSGMIWNASTGMWSATTEKGIRDSALESVRAELREMNTAYQARMDDIERYTREIASLKAEAAERQGD